MINYKYFCNDCGKQFLPNRKVFYLCPACGETKKEQPLKGVLSIKYDYEEINKKIQQKDFLELPAGKFWLYPELWPTNFDSIDYKMLQRLSLPEESLLEFELENGKIFILDETRNPTLSYKDRATSLVVLKAIELGIKEISAASTGNAGSSLAGICARLGLTSHIFVSKNITEEKRIQIEAYGADLVVVNGDYDKAFDVSLEVSKTEGWYNRNTAYNPLTIEGKKSAAYDIFIQTQGKVPDIIFIPVGDGVIISGIYKGFWELKQLGWIEKIPRLIGVQSTKSNAVVRYFNTSNFEYKRVKTIADSISAGAPRNLYMAVDSIRESCGDAVAVSDEDILSAQKEFIEQTGILCEPSSASVYTAYNRFIEEKRFKKREKVLLVITGNGLKDISSLKI
jgi:threonine synthase